MSERASGSGSGSGSGLGLGLGSGSGCPNPDPNRATTLYPNPNQAKTTWRPDLVRDAHRVRLGNGPATLQHLELDT
eukprot:scaffold136548_cov543-Phaeocystis_antarctica.AAC.1